MVKQGLKDWIVGKSSQATKKRTGEQADCCIIGSELTQDQMGQPVIKEKRFHFRDHFESCARLSGSGGKEIGQILGHPTRNTCEIQIEPLQASVERDQPNIRKARHQVIAHRWPKPGGTSASQPIRTCANHSEHIGQAGLYLGRKGAAGEKVAERAVTFCTKQDDATDRGKVIPHFLHLSRAKIGQDQTSWPMERRQDIARIS